MRFYWAVCILGLLTIAAPASAQEALAKSRIVSVGLFKNGLAVVKREVVIPEAGTYRLDASPEPVHGSFWIESNAKVEASVKMREIEVPLHAQGDIRLQSDLADKKVTLTFRNEKLGQVTGTLVKLGKPESPEGTMASGRAPAPHYQQTNFFIVKTAKGRLYINPSDVMMIQTDDADEKIIERRPVLILAVEKSAKKPTVFVSYLTSGLAWAPSYHVDISDPKSLSIQMAAVVRNEMADLQDAEIKLISGFPSVEFANVTSPLSAHTTWTRFFQEIQGRGSSSSDGIMTQQIALTNNISFRDSIARPRIDLGAIPAGEGVDLHYESIGKRTLLRDEAISLNVGKAKADYERVVEWTVGTSPLARRFIRRHELAKEEVKDEMWDVLLFKNPFQFPMTTAPAMVVENSRFNGQRTAYWTNIGEEAALKVTKSLSIRAISREQEDSKANESVVVDGQSFTKIYLKGELTMSNHRKQPIKMHIRHSIRGIISEVEGAPKQVTHEESLEDVNRVHEVIWTVTLNPGEERKLNYKYSVLRPRP